MTVRLELRPEVEAVLAAHAEERGVSLDTYLQSVVEALVTEEAERREKLVRLNATLDSLAEMGSGLRPLPSSAFRRDSIYSEPTAE